MTVEPDGSVKEEPTTHRQQRPPSGAKERKLVLRSAVLGKILGQVSEVRDFLQAIYDALPDDVKKRLHFERGTRRPRIPDLLEALYDHWDEVDLLQAAKNVIVQQGQDIIIGKANKAFGRAWIEAHEQLGLTPPAVTPLFGRTQQQYTTFGKVRKDGSLYTTPSSRRVPPPQRNPLRPPPRRQPQTAVDALFYR